MSSSFRFVPLSYDQFAPLFGQTDAELQTIGAVRTTVDEKPGYPCRVSLVDADVGETVLALPFTHHDVRSPYRASGPIFVRLGAKTAEPAAGEIPAMFAHRRLSIRAYDAEAMMIEADVVDGSGLEEAIRSLFADQAVRYLHLHNAGPGCYNCRVERA